MRSCGLIIVLPLTHETISKFKFCQWYLTIKILSPWEESSEPFRLVVQLSVSLNFFVLYENLYPGELALYLAMTATSPT